MKIYKSIKGVKINSEEEDGHKDGSEIFVIAQRTLSEEEREELLKVELNNGVKVPEKFYLAVFSEDKVPIPVLTTSHKVEITSEEVVDYTLSENFGQAMYDFYNQIVDTTINNMGFELIK